MTKIHEAVRSFLESKAHCFKASVSPVANFPTHALMMTMAGYKHGGDKLRAQAKKLARTNKEIPQWLAKYLANPAVFKSGPRRNHNRDRAIREAVQIALNAGAMSNNRAHDRVNSC